MIYLSRGSNKITFEGLSTHDPFKFNNKENRYLTGELFKSFRSKVNRLQIEVQKLTDAQFEKLKTMFFDTTTTAKFDIKTEEGNEYYMSIEGENLPLKYSVNEEDEKIWSGVLNFSE